MKKIAGDDKLLRQMIAAMDEGFRVLEALRYPLTPAAQASLIRKRPALMRLFMKIYHRMPISRLVDGPIGEIVALSRVFHLLKEQTGSLHPTGTNWGSVLRPRSTVRNFYPRSNQPMMILVLQRKLWSIIKQGAFSCLNLWNLTRQHDAFTGLYIQIKLQFQDALDQMSPEYKGVYRGSSFCGVVLKPCWSSRPLMPLWKPVSDKNIVLDWIKYRNSGSFGLKKGKSQTTAVLYLTNVSRLLKYINSLSYSPDHDI